MQCLLNTRVSKSVHSVSFFGPSYPSLSVFFSALYFFRSVFYLSLLICSLGRLVPFWSLSSIWYSKSDLINLMSLTSVIFHFWSAKNQIYLSNQFTTLWNWYYSWDWTKPLPYCSIAVFSYIFLPLFLWLSSVPPLLRRLELLTDWAATHSRETKTSVSWLHTEKHT